VLFHVKHAEERELARAAEDLAIPLSPPAVRRLLEFEGMLRQRAIPLGLISRSDRDRLRDRHVLDCLRAAAAVEDGDRLAFDVGSGAGLPGVIVAVARPGLSVRLVERRRSRGAFLEWVVETLALDNATVVLGRIEDQHEEADICFARAFAPPETAWNVSRSLLRSGGRLVYFGEVAEGLAAHAEAAVLRVMTTPLLACSGPLTIMTR
jgi:16S rRNA (guanine(527)-N(7))-methyltransferase RsmG